MSRLLHTLEKIASLLTKYIGLIIICFSVLAFFWRDGFAWTTNYTSVFLGVAMFGMGLTIHIGDFKVVFTRPKEVILGFIAHLCRSLPGFSQRHFTFRLILHWE